MSTAFEATDRTCVCSGDPDLDTLRDLVAAGHDQWAASRALWSPGSPVGNAVAVEIAGRQARRLVRDALARAFPGLRLPREVS